MLREAFDNPDTRIEDCCMSKTSKGSKDCLINKYIAEMLQDLSKVTLQAHSKDHEDSWRPTRPWVGSWPCCCVQRKFWNQRHRLILMQLHDKRRMEQVANNLLTIMFPWKNISKWLALHKLLMIPNYCWISFLLLTPALPARSLKSLLIDGAAFFFCLKWTFLSG